ncbi:sigma-70 family RNA polymerase sigma factor [bacterium]|nr:MAG: sigma-70 family RNA polymerase sigma factor [bacterium]
MVAGLSWISYFALTTGIWCRVEDQASDMRLMEKLRDSDMEAFRALFDRYQPIIFRQVLFHTGQTDLSHDIVQETFVRIWEHRANLRPHRSFLALALRISGNLVLDAAKHRKVRERLEGEVPRPVLSEGDDPHEALQLTMLEEELAAAIKGELGEKCRTVFLLSRFEGMKIREIAELLGLSPKTVENQINHALKVLRRRLRRYVEQ